MGEREAEGALAPKGTMYLLITFPENFTPQGRVGDADHWWPGLPAVPPCL